MCLTFNVFFVIVCNYHIYDTGYSVTETGGTARQHGSDPEFRVNFGSGRVGYTLVEGRVIKLGRTFNSGLTEY